jgi:hypothetical protein
MKYFKGILVVLCWNIYGATESNAWTWNYTKHFSEHEQKFNAGRTETIITKQDIAEFTQLIFSWNAVRPCKGYYSFYVQVRDAKTKTWGSWHKMIDWGAAIQKSYFTKSDGYAQYFHVRLETDAFRKADAFKIKLQAHDGANLSLVHRFTVNVSDFTKFISEQAKDLTYLSSIYVPNVPQKSQMVLDHPRSHELCSPTSSSMMTSYLCDCHVDPIDFAQKVFDSGLNAYGSWPFNTAHAYERCSGAAFFSTVRFNSFADLHAFLKRGVPVVVSVRGYLQGAPKSYPKGHLLVVVGYDAKKREVLCHDPAFTADEKTQVRYSLESFLAAWERSRRLAYVAECVL